MLSILEISDRLEIQDLLVRYSHAVDNRDWQLFRSVFTEDAWIDYSAFGSTRRGGLDLIIEGLAKDMPRFKSTQHAISNTWLQIDRDTADARTMCFNPVVEDDNGTDKITVYALWYIDKLVRTDGGWRIKSRVEEPCYVARPDSIKRV